jgi:L-asparaginase
VHDLPDHTTVAHPGRSGPRRRVAVLFTGGTLDALGTDRLDLAWYIEAKSRLDRGAFLEGLPELAHLAEVEEIPFRRLNSHALCDADWLELAARVDQALEADGYDGLVIGHGTNTLEETAYFLSLVLRTRKPVVLVGAMRPSSGLSSDGQLNVVNGVRIAASPDAGSHGVVVAVNDTVFAARGVTKASTYRLHAFDDRDHGPLGYADADGQVVWRRREERVPAAPAFDLGGRSGLPRVDVVTSYVGADGTAIRAFVAAGARGIVSAGTGAGRATPSEDEALDEALAAGVVVCQATRVGSGRVVRSPAIERRGMVAAGDLVPWKARVLLSLALSVTSDPAEIQAYFDRC